ncbi:BQ5605_C021g09387 [Microbotryum silenes-dioicae]|uniref:BQ5605_C021g09387 protein n=1 Tax=Microbotryum silenes-dioicae TaxID=796604 RepID=A0A2X0MNR0_9BASI|nr:BQ5605_C021g09387 [Microbotryum silenes-dioicae]
MTEFSYPAPALDSPAFSRGPGSVQTQARPSSSSGPPNSAGAASSYASSSYSPLTDPAGSSASSSAAAAANNAARQHASSAFEHLANAAARQDDGDSSAGSDRDQMASSNSRRISVQPPRHHLPSPTHRLPSPAQSQYLAHARQSPLGGNHDERGDQSPLSQNLSHVPTAQPPPPPPPFGHAVHFQGHPTPHIPGANIRNTRPMTAPSSVSAPYFQGGPYAPHHGHSGSFYPSSMPYPFSLGLDSGISPSGLPMVMHGGHISSHDPRSFSMSEAGHAHSEHQRYSSGPDEHGSPSSSSIFQYGPPPRASDAGFYPSSQDHDGFSHSRPTTADSRPGSSHAQAQTLRRGSEFSPPSQGKGSNSESRGQSGSSSKAYNFVTAAGQTTKRPRRRFDEIERLYGCDYPGCQKSYGTLNHLNSHKTMQKHGPKSTPAQFKEMRKAWRDTKKMQASLNGRSANNLTAAASTTTATSQAQTKSIYGVPSKDRVRPVTSAGEYHYNAPAPYLPPPSTSSIYGIPAPTLQLPPPPPSMYEAPAPPILSNPWASTGPAAFPLPPAPASAGSDLLYSHGSSPHRPVTAPTYYNQHTPSFGLQPTRFGFGINGGMAPGPGPLQPGRRLSLPGEIQQPTPIFGFNVPGGESGFSSIQEEESSSSAAQAGGE